MSEEYVSQATEAQGGGFDWRNVCGAILERIKDRVVLEEELLEWHLQCRCRICACLHSDDGGGGGGGGGAIVQAW